MTLLRRLFDISKPKKRWLVTMTIMLSIILLTGCEDNIINGANDSEVLTIELTDAEGDFNAYSVDILSLTLTKKDDTVVEVLPENTRIDFAQYVKMSEIFTTATVPAGVYKAATLTLDYSNAEIFVENVDGDNIQVASIIDEDNEIITTLQSKVSLDDRNYLRIVPGVPAHLSLDFDLKVSNIVNFDDPAAPVVTVSPVLNASLEPDSEKTHRVRGPLKNVDLDNNHFELVIRPFNKKLDHKKERFGSLRVNIDEETSFEINGESFIGSDGLASMETLERLAAVIVVGDITLRPRRFNATEVYAGSSVPGGEMDVVKGTVLSRVENTLIVKGVTLIRADGRADFNDEVIVIIDTTTKVKRQHERGDYTIDDISVGQRITLFGSLIDDAESTTLDASAGLARLLITTVSGIVVSEKDEASAQLFSVDLSNINRRRIGIFDFVGTGIDADNDADPMNYEVETATLNLDAFPLDSSVNIRGFVNSFGQAPADFIAKSIDNKKQIFTAKMHANWRPPTSAAFSLITNEKIVLDFSNSGRFHHISHGRRKLDLTKLDTRFSFVPVAEEIKVTYVIIVKGDSRHIHTNFGNFSNELVSLIENGSAVAVVQAKGKFDINTGEFFAKRIKVKMK